MIFPAHRHEALPDGFVCGHALALSAGTPAPPLPALDDEDGLRIPDGLPEVIDLHAHLFPDRVSAAIWRWFDQHGWPIRHKLHAPEVVQFLRGRGVGKIVGLHYAHTGGMAASLNRWIAAEFGGRDDVIPFATVYPGEVGAPQILEEAFRAGLRGVKLHCHVQTFAIDDPCMDEIAAVCAEWGRPLLVHAGREPRSPAYPVDPLTICHVDRTERLLARHPRLHLVVPHLGADEIPEYLDLVDRNDRLWLDTTMLVADYFPIEVRWDWLAKRSHRICYGSDFPNIPYAWDRELKRISEAGMSDAVVERIVGGNTRELLGL